MLSSRFQAGRPKPSRRVYARGALGRDHDHRHPDRPSASGGASSPRSRQTAAMLQQPEAVGPGDGKLRGRQRYFPYGVIYGSAGPGRSSPTAKCGATATTFGRRSSSPSGRIWKAENLHDKYDFNYTFYSHRTAPYEHLSCRSIIAPAIGRAAIWTGDQYTRLRGNYVTNWGYCDFTQTVAKPDGVNP